MTCNEAAVCAELQVSSSPTAPTALLCLTSFSHPPVGGIGLISPSWGGSGGLAEH